MKSFLGALAILAILSPLTTAASLGESKPEANDFIRTLKDLHRGSPAEPTMTRANVEERWITQWLDNFDGDNNATWEDRILINEDYFVDGSPIFIYLGGEWKIQPGDITSGLWVDIAKQHNGTIVTTEHRFFGESLPITPFSTENLEKYQNVNQALADVINVIENLKEEDKYKDSKIVIHGCSYSASMATWIRKLYPETILGSWASSAPLVAKVDFKEYFKVIGESYKVLGGQYCYDLIDNATSYYEDLFANGEGDQAKKELNLCDNFDADNKRDRWQIFSTIANIFAGIAQYQNPANYDIAQYCSVLRSFSDDDSVALSKFINWRIHEHSGQCISATFKGTTDYYEWAKDNYQDSMLPWFFQTCSEFGWFQSSGSRQQPFGSSFPSKLYEDTCETVFGSKYNTAGIRANAKATNAEFGGLDNDFTNVYFVQGQMDGWRKVGAGVEQGATIIPYASHCPDGGSISASDSPELVASKQKIIALVAQWLEEA
ncbi:putative serine protease K12H4.7 [Drosophila ananassae]|uniref:putative serine protease K12H4.7 n=1 Tax=Drosophila ananassae TaxID=7217 RepID=UPI000177BB38|nr:putative serine protease K12H4.7 [Drosophila ananassae]